MKTLKVSLAALLLTLAVGGAALQHASAAPKATDLTYDWQHFDRDGIHSEIAKVVKQYQKLKVIMDVAATKPFVL